MQRSRGKTTFWIGGAVVVVLVLAGLGGFVWHRSKESAADNAFARAVRGYAAAVPAKHLDQVGWVGTTGSAMQAEYAAAVAGMGAVTPSVRVKGQHRDGPKGTATVTTSWPLGTGATWTYSSTVSFAEQSGRWLVNPDGVQEASIFAPITRDSRLSLSRVQAPRGDITGKGGVKIVSTGTVVDVGIEPSRVTDASGLVAQVAHITDVDAGALKKALAAAKPDAFVPVITLRESDYLKVRDKLQPLKGTVFRSRQQPLTLTRDFARALLGGVGPVTADILKTSGNRYSAGDFAGVSGLERQYDAQLAGGSAYTVSEVPLKAAAGSTSSAVTLFKTAAQPGKDVATTLDPKVQNAADAALKTLSVPGSLVAMNVKTGAVLAVANTPSNGVDQALVGQYQPGSTLKVATTLALLKDGLKTSEVVNCPSKATVGGRTFRNYEHEQFGPVPFTTDFKNSCNTAFVGLSKRLKAGDLHTAAAQLGLGGTWAAGLGAGPQTYTGSIPTSTSATDQAAAAFGQGRNLVSPLSMAVMATTVARGKLVAPSLVTTPKPAAGGAADVATPSAKQIATLHSLMRLVVTSGTAAGKLSGVPGGPIYAKTGTAEFGSDSPPPTHAWLVGWQGNIAFAAFAQEGPSGATTAGPVVKSFLTHLHDG